MKKLHIFKEEEWEGKSEKRSVEEEKWESKKKKREREDRERVSQ